jgi:hypothetical protein
MQSSLIALFSIMIVGAVWAWADYKWIGAFVGIAGVVGLIVTLLKWTDPHTDGS